jgi:predicted neuraminidase
MSTYEEIKDDNGSIIKRTDEDGQVWWIPTNPANSDYQAYLASLGAQQANSGSSVANDPVGNK